jgi:hypothetical protein
MKNVVDILISKNLMVRSLSALNPKEVVGRKKLEIFYGVDTKSYYWAIFRITQKE